MSDSQKFVARNRAPRVQIEYDVELYGAQKKVQLPFVMGVLSDLSGAADKPSVDDRKFLEIDVDTFDDAMKSVAPKAQFTVPNTITGEGSLAVDLTFEKLSDFSPEAIAQKVDALAPLLEARRQLSDLLAYMDGKAGAEALIEKLLNAPEMLAAVASADNETADTDATLAALAAVTPSDVTGDDVQATDNILAAAIQEIPDTPPDTAQSDALASVARNVPEADEADQTDDALEELRAVAPQQIESPENDAQDVLSALATPEDKPEQRDDIADVLSGIETVVSDDVLDDSADVLEELKIAEPEPAEPVSDQTESILAAMDTVPEEHKEDISAVLDGIAPAEIPIKDEEQLDEVLAGIEAPTRLDIPAEDDTDVLAAVREAADPIQDDFDEVGDILSTLDTPDTDVADDTSADDILASLEPAEGRVEEGDNLDDILGNLDSAPSNERAAEDASGDILAALDTVATEDTVDDFGDILASLEVPTTEDEQGESLDAILDGLDDAAPESSADEVDLDALIADMATTDEATQPSGEAGPEVATLDDDLDLDDLLGELDADDEVSPETEDTAELDDLDALLADLDGGEEDTQGLGSAPTPDVEEDNLDDELAALLADLDEPSADGDHSVDETDTGNNDFIDDDLDDLLADLDMDEDDLDTADPDKAIASDGTPEPPAVQSPFGKMSAPRLTPADLERRKFRIAILGDFTGRAARGLRETGPALAQRSPILLDVDTVEDVIEGFATTLTLPIGKEGAGIEVKLGELDDLHPDELYENVEIFEALANIRQHLATGSMAEKAVERLREWGAAYAQPVRVPKRSAATSVPAHLKLSDFQALIGDTGGSLTQASPADDLIARIVGPHVVKAADQGVEAMRTCIDEALSSAMRLVLHHPDFQALEAQWRSLELLARRIETDSTLELVLYDISAEELAMDLAAHEDLAQSGLYQLVTDVLDPDEGTGGFSALAGLYTFEETPPHAELLARIGQVCSHVDAPFFAAMTPEFLKIAKEDRHPLVAQAWDTLRIVPEAAYLGLASPRFLARLPYGAKSEPTYAFDFEEFTPQEGLSGMLWANPVVMVTILLAATYKKDGAALELGSLMSLGDMPFHYVQDRYGDQVALPCTERNLTSDATQTALGRGFMPVLSIKGRNEIRLGSFRSLGGDMIAGPWTGAAGKPKTTEPLPPDVSMEMASAGEGADTAEAELDDLMSEFDDDIEADDDEMSLDDLLAAFDDDDDEVKPDDGDGDDDDLDAELAALLEGL